MILSFTKENYSHTFKACKNVHYKNKKKKQ